MGDQSSFQSMPGTVNSLSPIALPNDPQNDIKPPNTEEANNSLPHEPSDEPSIEIKPQRQRTGQRHVRQFSITSTTIANKRKSHDTAKFILLQKTAIETVRKCPSIIKYTAAAVEYTEQVWKSSHL